MGLHSGASIAAQSPGQAPCLAAPVYLKRRTDFVAVQTGGRRWRGRHFLLLIRPSPLAQRVGLTVSRRVGNAVRRNLVRRRLRHSLSALRADLLPDHDHVIIALPMAKDIDFWQLHADITSLLRRARAQLGRPP